MRAEEDTLGAAAETGRSSDKPDALVTGVSDVVTAALGIGASVARVFAEATAQGKSVKPARSARPLEVIIHYTVAAVTNVMGMVAAGVGAATSETGATEHGAGAPAAAPSASHEASARDASGMPTVRRGGTLRVPLSIENTGADPMQDLLVACRSVAGEALGSGNPLSERSLSFYPDVLGIAPRDFEKLTVFIATEPDTAPGRYEARIALGEAGGGASLRFEVLSDTASG